MGAASVGDEAGGGGQRTAKLGTYPTLLAREARKGVPLVIHIHLYKPNTTDQRIMISQKPHNG